MQITEWMAGGALAVSLLSLFFSVQAAWPQIKTWAEDLRDLVLWLALAGVLAALGWFGWNRYEQTRLPRSDGPPLSNADRVQLP